MVDLAQGLAETPYRAGDGIVAAVSGGADSMAMLDGLVRLPIAPLTVVHVHHGIRGAEADRDAALVESWCASHGISCRVYRVDIPAQAAREKSGWKNAGVGCAINCWPKRPTKWAPGGSQQRTRCRIRRKPSC